MNRAAKTAHIDEVLSQTSEPETRILAPSEITDRMIRPRRASCPECDAFPPVCTQKVRGFTAYRCRTCEHRWSEGAL